MATRPLHVVVPLDGMDEVGRARFHGDPSAWLPAPASPSPEGHRVDLATGSLLPGPYVRVHVDVGEVVVASGDLAVRALSWQAIRLAPAFPTLDAELELDTRLRPCLRLFGTYTPPLAVVGDVADRLVGRHLATEIVRGFLTSVGHRLVPGPDGPFIPEPAPSVLPRRDAARP